ncbi:MAG: hypothetical protein ABTS16_02780 [Candidatus Accumulibacter phosphatis]|uniref:Phage holin family protein n=1 Tax=Candidatus Accumulibacter contiguus TaxID=2954381 RepID=A0ABX1T7Y3_9PROT|nr:MULTISPECIES: hypothetical protein [Candidatus Accumulibacter]NMQ05188.1 hypothetical protein [Candidatus Accumulibacter contiguus]
MATGSMVSLIASLRAVGERFLALVMLECQQAGQSLAWMVGLALVATLLALVATLLALTGWLTMLACVVLTLVQNQIVGWEWALSIAALLSFAGAGGVVLMVIQQSRYLLFPATRRQLRRISDGREST